MNKKINVAIFIAMCALASNPVLAGGLDAGTELVSDVQAWLYKIAVGVAGCYVIYNIVMASFEKKSWNDVLMALAKAAAAGGITSAITYMVGLLIS